MTEREREVAGCGARALPLPPPSRAAPAPALQPRPPAPNGRALAWPVPLRGSTLHQIIKLQGRKALKLVRKLAKNSALEGEQV